MQGYYISLKSCLAGLALVSDMTVSCFLRGGELANIVFEVSRECANSNRQLAPVSTFDQFYQLCVAGRLEKARIEIINETIKNCKIRLVHSNFWRKAKSLGPASNSEASKFDYKGKKVTVEQYFNEVYKSKLFGPGGKLKYPFLPTVNVGSKNAPMLVPIELVVVPDGQCRTGAIAGTTAAAEMIKYDHPLLLFTQYLS